MISAVPVSESEFTMEFHEKLQELRKQNKLTQEQLAQILHVSRTAVSKWESGRGYPNIDSLKAIAKLYSVTVDELLSGEELLTIAEKDYAQKETSLCDRVFGLLDLSAVMLLFLPLLAQRSDGAIQEVSLWMLNDTARLLRIGYWSVVLSLCLLGVLTLTLQSCRNTFWVNYKRKLSLLLNVAGVLLFTVSLQPYAATFLFLFLIIKVFLLMKKR